MIVVLREIFLDILRVSFDVCLKQSPPALGAQQASQILPIFPKAFTIFTDVLIFGLRSKTQAVHMGQDVTEITKDISVFIRILREVADLTTRIVHFPPRTVLHFLSKKDYFLSLIDDLLFSTKE